MPRVPLLIEVLEDESLQTFSAIEILERARLLAAGWVAGGIREGESVILNLHGGAFWAGHMLGLLLAGAVPVTVSPSSGEDRILKRADITGARFLVTSWPSGGGTSFVTALGKRFERVVYTSPPRQGLGLGSDVPEEISKRLVRADVLVQQGATYLDIYSELPFQKMASPTEDMPCAVVFTGGAGGRPRGVVLTLSNLAATVEGLQERTPLSAGEVLLTFLGPEHVVGLVAFWWALWTGATILYHKGGLARARGASPASVIMSPLGVVELIRETESLSSGPAVRRLWKWAMQRLDASRPGRDKLFKRLPAEVAGGVVSRRFKELFGQRMRRVFCLGGILPEAHRKLLASGGLELITGYGTTETCGVSHLCVDAARVSGTAGLPLPGVTAKFSPSGEILVKGPQVARKVWTEDHGIDDVLREDGFFHTGDFGLLDEERLVVTGSESDFVRTKRAKVPGPDIEAFLATKPEIRRALVVGEDRPHLAALLEVDPDVLWQKTGGRGERPHDWRFWEDEQVDRLLRRVVAACNRTLDKHEMIRSFVVLPSGFSERDEEVDSSGRVLRHNVVRRHADLIESLYRE